MTDDNTPPGMVRIDGHTTDFNPSSDTDHDHDPDPDPEPVDLDRRLLGIPIRQEFAEDLFTGDLAVAAGLPDDATLVRTYDDTPRMEYVFVFKSRHFEPVAEGEEIPYVQLEIQQLNEDGSPRSRLTMSE